MKSFVRLWAFLSICLFAVSCTGSRLAPTRPAQPASQPEPIASQPSEEQESQDEESSASELIAVIVWDLEDLVAHDMSQPELGELLASRVADTIQKSGAYTVIPREKVTAAQRELHLASSAANDRATRLRLGKMLGAQRLVTGGYRVAEGKMQLELQMIEADSGKTLQTAQESAPSSSITGWLDAAQKAAAALL